MKKVALITGASSGIGKELALIHAKKGGDLVLVARREENLLKLKKEIESNYHVSVYIIVKDLIIPEAPQEIYNELKLKGIEIDYLINNAGYGALGKFYEIDLAHQIDMIQLNVSSLTTLTHLFLQDFTKKNSGKIMQVASTAGFVPGPLQAVYYATKAYVVSFSLAISEELSDTNITVTSLCPGATETEFGKVAKMEKSPLFSATASAQKVANDGYNGMLKGKLQVVSGLTFIQKILMAFVPFTPKIMVLKQVRALQEIKN